MAHSSSKQGTRQKKENTYLNAPKVLAIWKISIIATLTNQRLRSKKRQERNPFHDPSLQSHKGLRLLGLGREVRELLDGFGFQTGGIQWLLLLLPTFFLLFRPDFLLEISGRAWVAAGGEVKLKTMTYGQRRVGKSKCFSVQKEVAW